MNNLSPKPIWIYKFDAASIDDVLEDLENIEELSDHVLTEICDAFSSSIIARLPDKFCARRLYELDGKPKNEIELYTFYNICEQ